VRARTNGHHLPDRLEREMHCLLGRLFQGRGKEVALLEGEKGSPCERRNVVIETTSPPFW